jgi:hypothetical protein
MAAVIDARVFALQKLETQKRQGRRFWVAQGIEAEPKTCGF